MSNNDLISRKALMEHLRTILMSDVFPNWANMEQKVKCSVGILGNRFKLEIEAAPSVDAELVIHAKWIYDDLGNTHCSNCKRRIPFITEWDTDDDCGGAYDVEIEETDHCPNCGAKMDKEE